MKWYVISCKDCGWKSPTVSEEIAEKFRRTLGICQDCKEKGKKVEFTYTAVVFTNQGAL